MRKASIDQPRAAVVAPFASANSCEMPRHRKQDSDLWPVAWPLPWWLTLIAGLIVFFGAMCYWCYSLVNDVHQRFEVLEQVLGTTIDLAPVFQGLWPSVAFGGAIFGIRAVIWLYSRVSRYLSRVL
jgi:hypothetical protein